MRYCINCGAELPENSKFCLNCGTPIEPESTTTEQNCAWSPEEPTPQEGRRQFQSPVRYQSMVTCKACGAQVSKKAKKCPNCGARLKKRVGLIILLIIIGLILISSIFGGSEEETTKVGEVSTQTADVSESSTVSAKSAETETKSNAAAEQNVQTVYNVGDILHDGDMDIVYVASGDYIEENEFLLPSEGNKYIFLKFAFINTSDKNDTSVSSFSFECYADGYAASSYFGGEEDLSATLSAGRSTEGYVYFEVPSDASEIEVEYTTNWFTEDKITFVFEGNEDSGYVLEANAAASEDALKVGESIEGSTLNISYLSCYEDSSDNMFITPKDGYTYVTCEFEFENVSSSDVAVTYFSFDCFADGIVCDASYFRDDGISATLSAGRKAKGTVTFEVPIDATVVEVEYLTNFWTSNRVVFDASKY